MADQAHAVKKHFTHLLELKRKSASRGEIQKNAQMGLLLLLKLKDGFRKTAEDTESLRNIAAEAKDSLSQAHLQLENILYEQSYYDKEIQNCRSFQSAYTDEQIGLMSLEDFLKSQPDDVNLEELQNDGHQLLLKRLTHELEERQKMRRVLEQKQARKDALDRIVDAKYKQLNGIKPQLKVVAKATEPLRNTLEVSTVGLRNLLPVAELLPLPLSVVYSQLIAAQDTYDLKLSVNIFGSADSALRNLAADEGEYEDVTVPGIVTKRRKLDPSELNDTETLHKEHPLSLKLTLHTNGKQMLAVNFFYLVKLKIVTASCDNPADNTVLASLYPADTGSDTPNPANKLLQDGRFEYDKNRLDRPYRWAQQMAGIDFIPNLPLSATSSDPQVFEEGMKLLRVEKRIIHVVEQLRARKIALDSLKSQLDRLCAAQLPTSPTLPHKPYTTLMKWEERRGEAPVPSSSQRGTPTPEPAAMTTNEEAGERTTNAQASPAAAGNGTMDMDEDVLLYNGLDSGEAVTAVPSPPTPPPPYPAPVLYTPPAKTYQAILRRDQAEVELQVTVYQEYPTLVPQFKIATVWDVQKVLKYGRVSMARVSDPIVVNDINALEYEVNVRVLELTGAADPNRLLSYQVVHLMRCLDAYSQQWPGVARRKDALLPVVRGQDMRIVFKNDAFKK